MDARTLAASRRTDDGRWLELGVWGDADVARIEPFEAIELHVGDLWVGAHQAP